MREGLRRDGERWDGPRDEHLDGLPADGGGVGLHRQAEFRTGQTGRSAAQRARSVEGEEGPRLGAVDAVARRSAADDRLVPGAYRLTEEVLFERPHQILRAPGPRPP